MKSRTFLVLLVVFSLWYCNKEDDEQEVFAGVISCSSCTLYQSFDSLILIGGYNSLESVGLDVDLDGTADFAFEAIHQGSPGGLYHSSSRIVCLHSRASVAMAISYDTVVSYWIRSAIDTTIQPPPMFDSTAFQYTQNYYQDLILPEEYQLTTSQHQCALPLTYNSPINTSLQWSSDPLILLDENGTSYYYTEGNTLYGHINETIFGHWEYGETKYLGIRISGKYGWIRISTLNSSQVLILDGMVRK